MNAGDQTLSRDRDDGGQALVEHGRLRRVLGPLSALLVFLLSLYAVHHLLAGLSYAQVKAELLALSWRQLALAILATAGSFVALTGYDWSALRYIGKRLPYRTVAFASCCGYAVANTVGFSVLSGGAVRYRVYLSAGLEGAEVALVSLFSVVAMGIGILAVAALALVAHPEALAQVTRMSAGALRVLGAVVAAVFGALLSACFLRRGPLGLGPWRLRLPSGRIAIGQLALSVADIVCAGACLYVLLPPSELPFVAFLAVYSVAIVAGVASNVPGGLGVFETVILLGLDKAIAPDSITAALIAYRAVYYLLPLALATLALTARELFEHRAPVDAAVRRLGTWSARLVPGVVGGLTFASGALLLWSSATPAMPERLARLEAVLPLAVLEVSHVLAAAVGLALLVIARGLYRRLNGAYVLAIAFCVAGAVLSIGKGVDYEQGFALLGVAAILWASRHEFHRRTALVDVPFTGAWVISVLGALGAMAFLTLFAFRHVEYAHELWWQFAYDAQASRSMRAGLAVAVALLVLGTTRLLRPPRPSPRLPGPEAMGRAHEVVRRQDDPGANLVLMGDKRLLFSEQGEGFLMFGVRGSSWIALGDPIGSPEVIEELAWRFRELTDREGGRVAFYQTHADTLPLYLDMGLTPLKVGEEAIVPLEAFSLDGAQRKDLRYVLKRGEREGLVVEIFSPERVAPLIPQLAAISSAWLAQRHTREKQFSLGAFAPEYVQRFPLALLSERGRPTAFATLLTTDTKVEGSLDLMRHLPDCSRFAMEYLFIRLLLEFKAQGYRRFTLGMAPLAGLENHPLAPLWHRFGHLIYSRGERIYNFRGLRQFKAKFDPLWEPRYLVTLGGLNAPLVMADVAALISGGVRAVFTK